MIRPSVVEEVRSLLAEGKLSQRKIAKITGISRATVGAIAVGKRRDCESLRRRPSDEFPEPIGPPQRCPGCGGMVYMPCRLCRMRALKAGSSRPPIPLWLMQLDEPLGLELSGEDRVRYEEVRSQRELSGESEPGAADAWDEFELNDDDECELDPAGLGRFSQADLWDAFELDEEEPAVEQLGVADVGEPRQAEYDDLLTPDSICR